MSTEITAETSAKAAGKDKPKPPCPYCGGNVPKGRRRWDKDECSRRYTNDKRRVEAQYARETADLRERHRLEEVGDLVPLAEMPPLPAIPPQPDTTPEGLLRLLAHS